MLTYLSICAIMLKKENSMTEGQNNLQQMHYTRSCKEADARRQAWYEKQSKRSSEELKAEIDRFMDYYNQTSAFGLPVSILMAKKVLEERGCVLI